MEITYNILLYYCYTKIDHPDTFREEHHAYCLTLGLRGRIIIAHEGINGTISGTTTACMQYMEAVKKDPRFSHIQFKLTTHNQHAFSKLHVRVKSEIVHADLPHIDPTQKAGQYISPQELQQLKKQEEIILLDVRSHYEHRVGKFKDAITLDINNFREFPNHIHRLANYKKKKIVTYCTGGIKCEKASAYLLEQGFENVYQLHGGIIQYGLETDGSDFEGQCYVFDNRLTTKINQKNPQMIAFCYVCHTICERMVNCANPWCNLHIILCIPCGEQLSGACSEACKQHPDKRPYDDTGYYTKIPNGYNPYKNSKRNKKKSN